MEDLKLEDFAVTENGVPQTIRLCDFQKFDDGPPAPRTAAPIIASPPAAVPVTSGQIAPEKPGEFRYRNRRLLALYFDMTAMPVPDQLRALDAARKFINTQATASDLVAILEFSEGAVKVRQDFTDDREQLRATIDLIVAASQGLEDEDEDNQTGAAFGQNDSEFNIFNTDRQLSALQTAVNMLGRLTGRKSLVYFASGLRLRGVDNQAQLRATMNAAIRANVSFFPVDARGLQAAAPLGDSMKASPGAGAYTGGAAMTMANNFQRSQDTLYALAADTGGRAMFDYNDLSMGIVQAQKFVTSYYIIGYYTTNAQHDGKFCRIGITLKDFPSAKLDYRRGYFAPKEFVKFTSAEKERQLEDALMLDDPITDLTIAMEVNFFQLNRAEYYVPVMMKVPGSELVLAQKAGAERTVIDFVGEIKDDYGTTIQNIRDKVDVTLRGATAAELAKRHIQYDTGYTLLPGSYTIKVLVRDNETGRIGTYQNKFTVPNLNKEAARIPISSVVLSSQRITFGLYIL
jgi:VWFA-related protein